LRIEIEFETRLSDSIAAVEIAFAVTAIQLQRARMGLAAESCSRFVASRLFAPKNKLQRKARPALQWPHDILCLNFRRKNKDRLAPFPLFPFPEILHAEPFG